MNKLAAPLQVFRHDPPVEIVIEVVMCPLPLSQGSGQLARGVLNTLTTIWMGESARDVTNCGFELEGSGFN